jgi:hypothetical protein
MNKREFLAIAKECIHLLDKFFTMGTKISATETFPTKTYVTI